MPQQPSKREKSLRTACSPHMDAPSASLPLFAQAMRGMRDAVCPFTVGCFVCACASALSLCTARDQGAVGGSAILLFCRGAAALCS